MAKPSTAQVKRSFSALSHLHRQKSKIKIRGDGSLIDIDVSLSEPDTETLCSTLVIRNSVIE